MANFDDMTGWRKELEAWRLTDDYKNNVESHHAGSDDLVPVSYLIEFVELFLRNAECIEAFKEIDAWKAEKLRTNDENTNDYPGFAATTLAEFQSWYLYKKSLRPNRPSFRRAVRLAELVRNGEIPAAQSSGAILYLKQNHGDRFIDFGR
ncbi:hypothetical protein [Roseibium album]|uniref:hypothetical protein n=1 Tax=Roseibium album TaxID=311410 RepID=UPI0032989296